MKTKQKNERFVHYTSAEAAAAILKSKKVWMRSYSCMNDFMEVRYGLDLILDKDKKVFFKELQEALDEIQAGLSVEIVHRFKEMLNDGIHIACMSEHDKEEDETGRLSMWRAYSQTTGVAMVVNTHLFLKEIEAVKAYTAPVYYFNEVDFKEKFLTIADNIKKHADNIRRMDKETIEREVCNRLLFAVVATKHPGFKEEKEWRVVYFPKDECKHITRSIEVINGNPQPIYSIPVEWKKEVLPGAMINDILNSIIIGPTAYPEAIKKAFISLLEYAGVRDAKNKVFVSNIPLRR